MSDTHNPSPKRYPVALPCTYPLQIPSYKLDLFQQLGDLLLFKPKERSFFAHFFNDCFGLVAREHAKLTKTLPTSTVLRQVWCTPGWGRL